MTETIAHMTRETARGKHIKQSNSVGVNFNITYMCVYKDAHALPHLADTPLVKGMHLELIIYLRVYTQIM